MNASSNSSLIVSPSTVNFGAVPVGQTASSKVSLSNQGVAAVDVAQVTVAGQTFYLDSQTNLPVTIAPGGTYSFAMGFKPNASTSYSGQFMAVNSAAKPIAQGSLNGAGLAAAATGTAGLTVSPTSLGFGNVTVGSTSTLPVTLTSTGTGTVTINSATVSGANFSVSGATFPLTLNPKQTVTWQVQFASVATGAATGALTVRSNSSTNPTATVSLNATGVAATSPQLTMSPGSVAFGNVAVGSSVTKSVTLKSTGTGAVKISAAAVSGTGFTISGASFPMTLNPQKSVTLNVKFTPTKVSAATGMISITSNAVRHPEIDISLSGTGTTTPVLTVSASSLTFGSVAVGSSPTQTVTLTSSGTGAVTVNSASITGTGFTVSGSTFPVTLNPNQTLTLTVKFAPTAAGAVTGTLTISSTSSTNPTATVSVSGTGTASALLTVSPSSLAFGDVTDGSSATLPVTLTSSGTSAVTVNSASISGTGFTVSGATFPVTLNSSQAVTLTVKYAPTTPGAVTGTLTVSSNSSTNPTATVSLSGTGEHYVQLSWQAPTSSPVQVTGYNIYKATGGSSSYQLLSSTSQLTVTDSNVTSGTAYSYYVESVDSAGAVSGPSNVINVTIPTP